MAYDEDTESFNGDEFENFGDKFGVIVMIDSRQTMFIKDWLDENNEEQSRFILALKCCRTMLMNRIISRRKDLFGVVLFGTDKKDPKTNSKHVTLLLDLSYPSAGAVKLLDNLIADKDCDEVQRSYGSSQDISLADALWYCSSLFSRSGRNLDEKDIYLFTDQDNPCEGYPDKAHMARKRAKDLNQVNISLEVLPMDPNFDFTVFYKELVEIVNGIPLSELPDPLRRIEELNERINRLEHKTRRYSKLKLSLGNGVFVGISLYTLYREASVLPQQSLNRATNEPVKSVRQTIDGVTGELLLPSDLEEFITVAGGDIVFSKEEKEALTKVMEPGITLLGFKSSSLASAGMHCGPPSFAFPEESLIKGSKELVKTLVEQCIAKDKVAVCVLTPRHRAVTKFVCLVPSAGDDNTPCGFHVIPLPFYNDTREPDLPRSSDVSSNCIEVAKKVVKKLKMTYKPSNFTNPKLQRYWDYLEALALEYDAPADTMDTEENLAEQTKRLKPLANEFNDTFGLDGERSPTKRPSSTSSPSKRLKPSSSDDVYEEIKAAIKDKKVEKFVVKDLKEFLSEQNVDTRGMRKADMVQAVYKCKI